MTKIALCRFVAAPALMCGLAAGLAIPAHASADDPPPFSLSGYGTLGFAHSSQRKADYLIDPTRPFGPGFTHRISHDVDSRLAAQANAVLGREWSAVLQVVSQQGHDGSYAPAIEWANVKYQVTEDLSVRGGRIVLPIFMATDSRKVGYAHPWIRPPVEVYGMQPITTNDGVDAAMRIAGGDFTNTFQVTYGKAHTHFPAVANAAAAPGTVKADRIVTYVNTLEHGYLTARASYGHARLTVDGLQSLFGALREFGTEGNAIADKYDVSNKRATFAGVGLSYDPGAWMAMGEWTTFNTRSFSGEKSAWYVGAAYRFDKLQPYVTHAAVTSRSRRDDPGIPLTGLPQACAQTAAALNTGLNQLLAGTPVQKTTSLGLRWDFAQGAAFKAQWDHVRVGAGSAGTFGNLRPGFEAGGKARIVSAVVDFVF